MRQRRWTLKTEKFHFTKLSRPIQDETFNLQDRDVPKNVSRPQCRSLKTLTGEVCHLTICFLRFRSIIFFLIYPQASCITWMFTRPKDTKPETLYLQDRDETKRFDFSKLWRLRRSTFKTETFQTTSQDHLETETFKTETTSLDCNVTVYFYLQFLYTTERMLIYDTQTTCQCWEQNLNVKPISRPRPEWRWRPQPQDQDHMYKSNTRSRLQFARLHEQERVKPVLSVCGGSK